ncbi:MAG TPA: pantoate--beta-alanine ligase [Gemmatimonadaceae bacterium]|nr:pantoate--beta-alanine ligase [Gemmatimonadaceae bacterium]
MQTIAGITELRATLGAARAAGRRTAFVPTMGALHEGHLTLIDAARAAGDLVVMSIFVNPLQFAPGEDYQRYPRVLAEDTRLAEQRGVDILFTPSREEIYGQTPVVTVHPGGIGKEWEGAARPQHFEGVLTVVAKLFNIVEPVVAVFGQKDLQQVAVVKAMVRDLDFPLEVLVVPIMREADGLAMSSRNRFLAGKERELATMLSKALFKLRDTFAGGERRASALEAVGWRMLERLPGLTPRYLAAVSPVTFQRVNIVKPGDAAIGAIRVGDTRLIDNIIF